MHFPSPFPSQCPITIHKMFSTAWQTRGVQYAGGLTGVRSSGVDMGELSLFNLIPLPKSKSQILTGEIWQWCKNQLFKWIYISLSYVMCGISTIHVGSKFSTIIYQYHITILQWVKLSKLLLHWLHSGLIRLSYLYSKLTLSARSQRMFSGFRSLCAIPGGEKLNKISHMFVIKCDHCLMIKEKFWVSFV